MNLYVASSWRNPLQPEIVAMLRTAGHEVYDFRNPAPGCYGFRWSDIDPNWQHWTPEEFCASLRNPIARDGFQRDWDAMQEADGCVLLMPCGRSAHLEAGYFIGADKPVFILLCSGEPELMYSLATVRCCSSDDLLLAIEAHLEGA